MVSLVVFENTILILLANSETTPSVHALSLNGSNPDMLPQFVEEAHKNVSFTTLDWSE